MAILPKQLIGFFKLKNGTPSTGLTPTIRIWEVTPTTNTLVVGGGSPEVFMTEVGDGFYKYRFATYDSTLRYAFRLDGEGGVGAPNLGVGRYVPGTNDSFVDDIADGVWAQPTGSPATQTYGDLLNVIGTSVLGSPQSTLTVSSIVSGVWSELITGSPQPYPTGSAGGVLKLVSETSGLTQDQVANAVWTATGSDFPIGSPLTFGGQLNTVYSYARSEIYIDTSLGTIGNGNPDSPYNNFTSAVDDAEANNISRLILLNDATADRQLKNFTFVGRGNPALDLAGFNVNKSEFENLRLDGSYAGTITAYNCELSDGLFGVHGEFHDCGLLGKITLALVSGGSPQGDANVLLHNCYSHIAGLGAPEIDMNAAGSTQFLSVRNYSGGLLLSNSTDAGNEITLEVSQGRVFLANTNTAGTISVRGVAFLSDLTAGATVDTSALLEPVDIDTITTIVETLIKYQDNRTFLDKVAKTLTVYDDDQVTPIRIFSLRDATGTPSITEIVERLPIGPGSPV